MVGTCFFVREFVLFSFKDTTFFSCLSHQMVSGTSTVEYSSRPENMLSGNRRYRAIHLFSGYVLVYGVLSSSENEHFFSHFVV